MKSSLPEQLSVSPLVWITAALLGGILLGSTQYEAITTLTWLELAALALIAALALFRLHVKVRLSVLLLPFVLFLGAARFQYSLPVITPTTAAYYNDLDRRIYVTGTLAEPPDIRDTYTNLRINVTALDLGQGDIAVEGVVLVRMNNAYDVSYGNHVRVRGYMKTPRNNEEFSYRDYLLRQGILSTLETESVTILPGNTRDPTLVLLYRIQNSLYKRINQLYPDPEAALLNGILLGADKALPVRVQMAFKNTGTSHIIAISGFNIAIIAAVLILVFSRVFGKKWGVALAILGIIFYTLLVGASASVVRAALMGSMTLIGATFGRRNLAATGLSSAAFVMALLNPQVLWDISFQLSFAATLGLVIYAEPMQDAISTFLTRYLPEASVERFIAPFSSYFLLTFAAQLTTLPVSFYHFGRISLSAFITNPFILPAQPAIMILGGLSALLSRLYMPLGQGLAWLTWPFAAYTIRMVEFFDKIPSGVLILGEFSLLTGILFYVILFSLTFFWAQVKGYATPGFVITTLAVLTFITWRAVMVMPDGRLHVLFMNVGSADGILITTPSGRYVLINGGESPSTLADQLGRRIPPFVRSIDLLVVASTQENQLGALPRILDQYNPKSVLWSGNEQASFSSRQLRELLLTMHTTLETPEANSSYALGDGVTLRILAVSARGAVLGLEMGNFKALLPIGVNFDSFKELKNGRGLGPVTALLLAESGYAPSNPAEWLVNISPQMVVLSVAADDKDGLPAEDVISSFDKYNLLRTDKLGWIDLASNGQQLWMTSEHK